MPDKVLLQELLKRASTGSRKFSDEEQQLRDLWNEQPRTTNYPSLLNDDVEITPGHPGMFQPEPTIIGQELGKLAHKFFGIAPNLKGKVSRIQYGPGTPAIQEIGESADAFPKGRQYKPEDFGMLNLLGVTHMNTKEINLNPSLGSPEYLRLHGNTAEYGDSPPNQVLAHELTHAAGYGSEKQPKIAQVLAGRIKETK